MSTDTTSKRAKQHARQAIEASRTMLCELSHTIHDRPELAFEEHHAANHIATVLERAGLHVERGVGGLDTALAARAGNGELCVGLCAEYDALPEVGHACGHNIIAASAVGAVTGLAGAAADAGLTVRLIGTPAEEIGDNGGKQLLLDAGVFDGVHAVLMTHPGPQNVLANPFYAVSTFDICYRGRASHAAAFPELGVNAGDALVIAQVAIGLLRQQLPPGILVHGIVTRGGEAANIIPGETRARYMVRAPSLELLEEYRPRVLRCFEAGATGTGAALEIAGGNHPYAEVQHDRGLADIFANNWRALGHDFTVDHDPRPGASTDLGNISRVIPAIHPLLSIGAAPGVANHHPSFAAASVEPPADDLIVDAAIALAWTAIDAAVDPGERTRLLERGAYRSRPNTEAVIETPTAKGTVA